MGHAHHLLTGHAHLIMIMAAPEANTDNPFSFKSFVSKRESKDEGGAKKTRNKGGGGGKTKKASKGEGGSDKAEISLFPEAEGSGVRPAKVEDNPFSFKKFVKKKQQQAKTGQSSQHHSSDSDEDEDQSGPFAPPNPPLILDPLRTGIDPLAKPASLTVALESSEEEEIAQERVIATPALSNLDPLGMMPAPGPLVTEEPIFNSLEARGDSSESSEDENGGLRGHPDVGVLLEDSDRLLVNEVRVSLSHTHTHTHTHTLCLSLSFSLPLLLSFPSPPPSTFPINHQLHKENEQLKQKLQKADKLLNKERKK